jgi:hypothetical protein
VSSVRTTGCPASACIACVLFAAVAARLMVMADHMRCPHQAGVVADHTRCLQRARSRLTERTQLTAVPLGNDVPWLGGRLTSNVLLKAYRETNRQTVGVRLVPFRCLTGPSQGMQLQACVVAMMDAGASSSGSSHPRLHAVQRLGCVAPARRLRRGSEAQALRQCARWASRSLTVSAMFMWQFVR